MDWSKFADFGLPGIFLGAIIFILYRMIVWVMAFVKEITLQQAKEREAWNKKDELNMGIIGSLKSSIDYHNQQSMEARAQQTEAHRFQREEHKEMIEILGRINGFKHN